MNRESDFRTRPRAPYGRQDRSDLARSPDGAALSRPYQEQTYHERPAIKPGHYKWLIVEYFWVGGIAGGAQILANVADFCGREQDRVIVRHGRYLALAGNVIGPALLIADLHTPQRFYNMLRIFRPTSPMSIGSWTLAASGMLSGLAALAQALEDFGGAVRWRRFGRRVGLPAAVAGAVMACYTGTLLSATSVPFWAAVPKRLPALCGASACANAAAALTLCTKLAGAPQPVTDRLEKFEIACGAAELALMAATDRQWRQEGVDGPVREGTLSVAHALGAVTLGVGVPLAIHAAQMLTGRKSKAASLFAAASTLVGGFILRSVVVFGGQQSAQRPRDYFHFTQPSVAASGSLAGLEDRRDDAHAAAMGLPGE